MPTDKTYRIVTAQQYHDGWIEMVGCLIYRNGYSLVRKLPDGTFLVVEPAARGVDQYADRQDRP